MIQETKSVDHTQDENGNPVTNIVLNPPKELETVNTGLSMIHKSEDDILLQHIEATAQKKEHYISLDYLIDCIDFYEQYDNTKEFESTTLDLRPLCYYSGEQFAKLITDILERTKIEAIEQDNIKHEFNKIEWNGSVALLGYIFSELANKNIIQWPLKKTGDPDYMTLAKKLSCFIQYKGLVASLSNALSQEYNNLSDSSKDKLDPFLKSLPQLPDIKEL